MQVLTLQVPEPEPESEKETETRVQPFWVAVADPVVEMSVEPPQETVAGPGAVKVGALLVSMTRMV